MKRGISLAVATVFGLVLMAGAASAFAALPAPIQAKIPFDFIVGKTTLPAGEYLISSPSDTSTGLLAIRSENGKPAIFVQADPYSPKGDRWVANTKLTFEKIDGKEYLTGIWESGSDMGYSISPSVLNVKTERAGKAGGK